MGKIDIMFTDNKILNNQLIGTITIDGVKTNQVTTIDNLVNMISGAINDSTGFLLHQETPVFNVFHTVMNNDQELNIYFSTATETYQPYINQLKTCVLPQIIKLTLRASTKEEAEKLVNNQTEIVRPLETINEIVQLFNQGQVTSIYTNNDFDKIIYEIIIKDGKKYQIIVPSNTISYNEPVLTRLNSLIYRANNKVKEPIIEQVGIIQEKLPVHQNNDNLIANNILLKPQEADAFPVEYNNKPTNSPQDENNNIFNQPLVQPQAQPVPQPTSYIEKTKYNRLALNAIKDKTIMLLTFANVHRATKINIDQSKAYI